MALLVLDVGQCVPDHRRISRWFQSQLDAQVEQADVAIDAARMIAEKKYDLVLVNRELDADGFSGVELIASLRRMTDPPPLMLVSNYPDAQDAAIAVGALPGFGKLQIYDRAVAERIKNSLSEPRR